MTADPAVQATAFLAAACRAAELQRPAPRVRDELAPRFVAARPDHLPDYGGLLAAGGDEVVTRTALLDAALVETVAASPSPPVVVNLGAGFCTRPYRLDLSACPLVLELDAPPVLRLKTELVADQPASCPVERIGLDLRDGRALAAALAARCADAAEVVVLSEGLLPYLSSEAVTTLAATLAGALRSATWLTDVVSVESALGMTELARGTGAGLTVYGLDSLAPLQDGGWQAVDYRILPVARRTVPAGPRRPGARASHRVVDGVVVLRRDRAGQPVPGRTSPDS